VQNIYYSECIQFERFFKLLKKEYKVFSPAIKDPSSPVADYYYQPASEETIFTYNPYRAVEPLKAFFTHPYEEVSTYFAPEQKEMPQGELIIVFGVKSCDIAGHKIQDYVFMEGVDVDSLYRVRRENTFLIASDCTDFKEVCHCLAWEIQPYPTEGFDWNLSPLNEGFIVEVGSPRGEALIQKYKEYFTPAKETQVSARKVKREKVVDRLKRHLLPQGLVSKDVVQKLVRDGFNAETWKQFMLTCVECGGCNLICDTCHCFLLADIQKKEGINRKVRVWDSCLYANYARVAGGANPLKTRAQRLRNRFLKKFDFFIDNLGVPACCGCGRCIEVCPGKIDIREVLKDLAQKATPKT
jgi:ferredoxin